MRRPAVLLLVLSSLVVMPAPAGAAAGPAASIGTVDCVNGGAYANMSNAGNQPTTFTIQRDGATVDTVVLERATVGASRLVPIAEGATATITVDMGGAGYVSASVTRSCATDAAAAPAAQETAVAGVQEGPQSESAASAAIAAAAPQPDGELPFSGPADGVSIAALGGVLLTCGTMLLLTATRSKRSPTGPARRSIGPRTER